MSSTSPVKIASFSSHEEAASAIELLASAGLVASISEPKWKLFGLLQPQPARHVHLQAPELFALECQATLARIFPESLTNLEGKLTAVCPKCGSLEYKQVGDSKKAALLVVILLGLVARHTGNRRECKSCGEITKT